MKQDKYEVDNKSEAMFVNGAKVAPITKDKYLKGKAPVTKIVNDAGKISRNNSSRRILFVAIVIIVFVLTLVGIKMFADNKVGQQGTDSSKAVVPEISEGKSSEQVFQDEYNSSVNDLLAETKSADVQKQYQAYIDLAYAAYRINKYEEALGYVGEAESLQQTNLTADIYGMIYYDMKDYKKSAKYYEIASQRVPKETDPNKNSLYNDYIALMKKAQEQL